MNHKVRRRDACYETKHGCSICYTHRCIFLSDCYIICISVYVYDKVVNWSEAPIVMRFLTFPFLEGSRAIVGLRQLQAISGVNWGLIGATRISCSVKHEPLVRDKEVGLLEP